MAKGIYTPDEVVTQYRQAKDKKAQIHILAELQQCSESEIVELLRERGAITDVNVRIRELFDQGESQRRIAEILGIDRNTVRARERAMGLDRKELGGSGHAMSEREVELIREKAAAGMVATEIARDIGRSYPAVRAVAKRYNIKLPAATRGGQFAGVKEWIADEELDQSAKKDVPEPDEKEAPEKPVEIGKPRIVLSPTKPLSFDDRIEAVRFLSALFGATPLDCRIEGELITLKFPAGMCQLHACMWEVAE